MTYKMLSCTDLEGLSSAGCPLHGGWARLVLPLHEAGLQSARVMGSGRARSPRSCSFLWALAARRQLGWGAVLPQGVRQRELQGVQGVARWGKRHFRQVRPVMSLPLWPFCYPCCLSSRRLSVSFLCSSHLRPTSLFSLCYLQADQTAVIITSVVF